MALEGNDKRALMILGIVAAIAVVVGGFLLLTGGGDDAATESPAGTVPTASGSAAPAPPTTDPVSPPPVVPDAGSVDGPLIGGRDPFSPFPVSLTPSAGVPVSGSPSPTSGGEIPNSTTVDGNEVILESILERKASVVEVSVSGSGYRAGEGDTFARYYTVEAIDTGAACANFKYVKGAIDESFILCIE